MARRGKEKGADVKPVESATNSNADDVKPVESATNSNADDVKPVESTANSNVDDVKVGRSESQVIEPIGYSVKLRDIHPQDSYGRCGYRFNKTDATYFSVDELTGEQVVTLAEDPWLELIPVCEE
ncbi:hypothetical protein ACFGZ1_11080 [Pasteurella multocida]